jgi:hypothetical protein
VSRKLLGVFNGTGGFLAGSRSFPIRLRWIMAVGIRQREIDQGFALACCSRPLSDLVIEK